MSGTDDDVVTVDVAFPKMKAVAPLDDLRVRVTWVDGDQVVVDLAPTIHTFKVYAPLRTDRALFETVHVVDASVIAWGEGGTIDMHVAEVERLAGEVMEAADFRAFLKDLRLTRDAAAAQLGISRRMVGYYAGGHGVPRSIALACRMLRHQAGPPAKRSA